MPLDGHPLSPLVRKLALHAPLGAGDRDAILALPHQIRTFEPHAHLIREGDAPAHCAVLLSGFAYRQKTTGDGSRQIVALGMPGDALDLQNMHFDESDHGVQALTRAEVACVPRREIQRIAAERPAVAHAFLLHILVEAAVLREWVLNIGRRDARTRMAHLLCEFATRLESRGEGDGGGYELPMTQELLADALGLTPVHVNRTLKVLEGEGLITRAGRSIRFPDWARMCEAGDFNARYLHLGPQDA